MHHSGWWPDYVTRLLRQGCGCFSDDYVHERILVDGETKTLKNSLLHKTMPSLEEAIDKTNQYSTLGIDKLNKAGIPPSFSRAIIKGLWAFIRTYLLRQGFRDGKHGFILAVHNAETTYYKYLKHWLTHEHVHSQRQRLLRQHP